MRHFQYLSRSLVPRSVRSAKGMPPTPRGQHDLTTAILQEADVVCHESVTCPPPIAGSRRMRLAEIRRVVAFSGRGSSPPGGVVVGWKSVRPGRTPPCQPGSCSRPRPGGQREPASAALRFSAAVPAQGWRKPHTGQGAWITRRVLRGCHVFWPLAYSGGSSRSCGRGMGRAVPSCTQGRREQRLRAVTSPAPRPRRRLYERDAALGRPRLAATPDAADASRGSHSMATSQSAALARLDEEAVSAPSA